MVGREAELAQLHEWWARALKGQRQVVVVTGEAGIGKTTVVDAFAAQVWGTEPAWIGRGQCIEQYGAGEAYLPLLEALGRLCRGPDGIVSLTYYTNTHQAGSCSCRRSCQRLSLKRSSAG